MKKKLDTSGLDLTKYKGLKVSISVQGFPVSASNFLVENLGR
jgi:hypothetical protein